MKDKIESFVQNLKTNMASERGDIGDGFMMMIAVLAALGIMFLFPMMTIADNADEIAVQEIQAACQKLIDESCSAGQITPEALNELRNTIIATGIDCDVELVVGVLDENAGKKAVQVQREKIGENWYYYIYNAQILHVVDDEGRPYTLKPGDRVEVKCKNSSLSWSERAGAFVWSVLGKDVSTISCGASGMSTATGSGT